LSVTFLNDKDYEHFAMKALEYRNGFGTIAYEKVCNCAPAFSIFSKRWAELWRSWKAIKSAFLRFSGDAVHQSRLNLALKCTPWVYSSVSNLAQIGPGCGYRSPKNSLGDQGDIWHGRVYHGRALACWI